MVSRAKISSTTEDEYDDENNPIEDIIDLLNYYVVKIIFFIFNILLPGIF